MLSRRFDEALSVASELHRAQLRKGTRVPYLAHLLAVASIALEYGADEDQAIAALLHDAVEDQGGADTLGLIRARFGEQVALIVSGCTDTDAVPKPPWRARKEAYVVHLSGAPPAVCLVSAADKLHNARAILADYRIHGDALWERFSGGKDGTLWYYRSLVEAFRGRVPEGLHDELARVVEDLGALAGASEAEPA